MDYLIPYIPNVNCKHLVCDITFNTKSEDIIKSLKPSHSMLILNDLINNIKVINKLVTEIVSKLDHKIRIVYWSDYLDTLPDYLDLTNIDYIKIGSYKEDKGTLATGDSNQSVYEVHHLKQSIFNEDHYQHVLKDITNKYRNAN